MTAREVELTGGAPWGFRMHGGADQNQPLRISRVNPGRKASLSGIREGDVISSINGRPTRSMSNNDAHAMLRSAGPVLRLGLNEDREMSPRRRSIGKSNELKRPSQLIAEVQSGRATPQAPVYATIRPSPSPINRPSSSAIRSSLTSLPSALNSTPLVKSVTTSEEPLRFHPTNPFYTTLPSNYSRLPVPNGRTSLTSLDKSKMKDTLCNDYSSVLKSPSFILKSQDCDSSSNPPYSHLNHNRSINGYDFEQQESTSNDKSDAYSYSNRFNQFYNQSLPKVGKNPFEAKRNSDPLEKYLRPESKINGQSEQEKPIPNSMSDNNFKMKEEITKRSTITEHKINEVEEVKTIKKILLNGCDDTRETRREHKLRLSLPAYEKTNNFSNEFNQSKNEFTSTTNNKSSRNERVLRTPTQDYSSSSIEHNQEKRNSSSSKPFRSPLDCYLHSPAEAPSTEFVTEKPPVKSPNTPTSGTLQSPTTKRE